MKNSEKANETDAYALVFSQLMGKGRFSLDNSVLRLVAIIIGGLSLYLGYNLFIKGVTGQASISLNTSTVTGQMLNAAPGAFFALAGVVIIIISLYNKEEITIMHPNKLVFEEYYKPKTNDSVNGSVREQSHIDSGSRILTKRKTSSQPFRNSDIDLDKLETPVFIRRNEN